MKVKLSFDDARVKKDLQYSSVISASIGFPYLHPFFHPVPIHFLLMDSFPRLHNALLHNVTRAREREREREATKDNCQLAMFPGRYLPLRVTGRC